MAIRPVVPPQLIDGEAFLLARPPTSLWRDALRRLARNRMAVLGGVIALVLIGTAILAPLLAPYDPVKQDYNAVLSPPSREHVMGTDGLGRDVLSRLIFGARTSMTVGVFTQFIILAIGLSIGASAGLAGGRVDNLAMRFTDIMYAFPDLLLIILLRSIFGGTVIMVFVAIGLAGWVTVARLVRGQILSLKERDYVEAARAMGAGQFRILRQHLLPNALGPIIVALTFGIPAAIFAEAALSYIGAGITPPTPSWGSMIQDGFQAIFAFPYLVLYPGLAIAVTMMSFTFLGDGLRDALDPRMRR
ncbi:MAG TPA: ABC transporter permease [Dehalococcoidia bacterium]|nr:ABC transporter permease [Dehalococcoidia bacterium]